MSSTSLAKTCTTCGQDVAKKPRVKDQQGRYFCEPCFAKLSAAGKAHEAVRAHSSPSVQALSEDKSRPALVDLPGGAVVPGESGRLIMRRAAASGPIAFSDDAAESDKATRRADELEMCPDCAMPMRHDANICTACGFNRATGRPVGPTYDDGSPAPKRRVRSCTNCGYDLHGLRTAKCPECGHINVPRGRLELAEKPPRVVTKWSYIMPLIVLGVWAVLNIAFDFSGTGSILRAGVYLGATCVLGIPIYWALNLFYIDNREPVYLMAIGVAAVYAGADTVVASFIAAFGAAGFIVFYWTFILPLTLHAFFFKPLLALEWKEAFVAAVPAAVIAGIVGVVAIAVL